MKKYFYRAMVILAVSLLVAPISFSQEDKDKKTSQVKTKQEVEQLLKKLFEQRRNKEVITVDDRDILKENPADVLDLLKPYTADVSGSIRNFAYVLMRNIGAESKNTEIRREVTKELVKGLKDPDSFGWWACTAKLLLGFTAIDFTQEGKSILHELLKEKEPRYEVILVVGVANMQEEMDTLGKLLIDESQYRDESLRKLYYTVGWAARLARARMGSKPDINLVIELVEKHPDEDRKVTEFLQYFEYIRQPEAIIILKRYLDSEKTTGYYGEDVIRMPYAAYALDALARCLDDFPVKQYAFPESGIPIARKWMADKKNWENSIRGKTQDKDKKDDSSHNKDKDKEHKDNDGKDDKSGQPDKKESLPPPVRDK